MRPLNTTNCAHQRVANISLVRSAVMVTARAKARIRDTNLHVPGAFYIRRRVRGTAASGGRPSIRRRVDYGRGARWPPARGRAPAPQTSPRDSGHGAHVRATPLAGVPTLPQTRPCHAPEPGRVAAPRPIPVIRCRSWPPHPEYRLSRIDGRPYFRTLFFEFTCPVPLSSWDVPAGMIPNRRPMIAGSYPRPAAPESSWRSSADRTSFQAAWSRAMSRRR